MRSIFWAVVYAAMSSTLLQAFEVDLKRPNIVYIIIDELGYYEPAFMGGVTIQTPSMDRMASEGIRMNNMFAGAPVCAPTRCCLLTGKHSGHTSVRANGGGTPLRADEATIASMLKERGYATGGFGKWGCGGRDSTGVPEKHGFDTFFGYYDQVHAHSFYPPYLIRNSEEVPLEGNQGGSNGKTYSQYVIHDAAKAFIRDRAKEHFFAYLPYTPPHGLFDIPDTDPSWAIYKDRPWPEPARRYAGETRKCTCQVSASMPETAHFGQCLLRQKRPAEAKPLLVGVLRDNPKHDYNYTAMAYAETLTALGETDDALKTWQFVVANNSYPRAKVQLAELYLAQNQPNLARAELKDVLVEDPHAPSFQRRRDRVWVSRAKSLMQKLP